MKMADGFRGILTDIPSSDVERLKENFERKATELLKRVRYESENAYQIVGIIIPYDFGEFEMDKLFCLEKITEYEKKNDEYRRFVKFFPGEDVIVPIHYSSILRQYVEWSGGTFNGYPMDKNELAYRFAEELVSNGFKVEFVFSREKFDDWNFSGLAAVFK